MIYKNKYNELWCECGNRTHLDGFAHYHIDKNKGVNCEGFCKKNNWYCSRCDKTINFDEAELKKAPEEEPVGL